MDVIQDHRKKFQNCVQKIIENLDCTTKVRLKELLTEKLHTESWLWAKAVRLLYSQIIPSPLVEIYNEFVNKRKETDSKLGIIHLTQTFRDSLTYENVQDTFGNVENVIILRCLLHHGHDLDVQIAENFSRIESMRSKNISEFLYERYVSFFLRFF